MCLTDAYFTVMIVMIKLSLIGAGNIAAAHAAAAESLAGRVEVVAVVDPRLSAASAMADRFGAKAFESVAHLLADATTAEAIGAALICTPPSARVDLVQQVLERGWAVLVEKPLAHRLIDAERLSRLSASFPNQPAAVGLCHRFTPAVDAMAEITRRGEIGRLVRVENVFAATIPGMDTHWMSDPEVSGGGSLLDAGSHSLDLMQHLVGPCELAGAVTSHAWPGRGDSNATILLRGGAGGVTESLAPVACQIATGWAEPTRFHLRLTGERGAIAYDFEKAQQLTVIDASGETRVDSVETHESRFARQLDRFLASVEARRLLAPLCSFTDAARIMRLIAKIDNAVLPDARVLAQSSSMVAAAKKQPVATTS